MALRWIEGFEVAGNNFVLNRLYADLDIPGAFSTTTGRQGGLGALASDWSLLTKPLVGAASATWTAGFEFNQRSGTLTAPGPFIGFYNGTQEQIRLQLAEYTIPGGVIATKGFKLEVIVGGSTIATSNEFFPYFPNNLLSRYIEFSVVIGDGSAGDFYAQVSDIYGTTETTTVTWTAANTSVDTQGLGITGADSCKLSNQNNSTHIFDNWYVADDATFRGPVYVQGYLPGVDGDTADWALDGGATTLADALAETATEGSVGEDDKRLSSSVISEEHLCTLVNADIGGVNIVGASSTVLGVRVDMHARMETAGDLDLGLRWRQSSTTVEEGSLNVDSGTMKALSYISTVNPITASAWVGTEPSALQIGVINNG